jgi:SAM-dependent methyltransferase
MKNKDNQLKLLDVGCGDGKFLDYIKENKVLNINSFGLDPTNESALKCSNKGHKVFCMDTKKFKANFQNELFDTITSFHVLEHIANPKTFMQELVSLIQPTGEIFISTPFSPMDFELQWFDPLNHPPHHMGRWNISSYRKLALELELNVEFFMPEPSSLINSTLNSFFFSKYGTSIKVSKKEKIISILKTPNRFIFHLYKQSKREKVLNRRAANVILVKFTKKL